MPDQPAHNGRKAGTDADARKIIEYAVEQLKDAGVQVESIDFESVDGAYLFTVRRAQTIKLTTDEVVRAAPIRLLEQFGVHVKDAAIADQRIGRYLTAIGALAPDDVIDVLEQQTLGDERRFGEIAVERGYLKQDVLDQLPNHHRSDRTARRRDRASG